MKSFLKQWATPISLRLGAVISSGLVGMGVANNLAEDVALGVAALVMIGLDLFLTGPKETK